MESCATQVVRGRLRSKPTNSGHQENMTARSPALNVLLSADLLLVGSVLKSISDSP